MAGFQNKKTCSEIHTLNQEAPLIAGNCEKTDTS